MKGGRFVTNHAEKKAGLFTGDAWPVNIDPFLEQRPSGVVPYFREILP